MNINLAIFSLGRITVIAILIKISHTLTYECCFCLGSTTEKTKKQQKKTTTQES